MAVIARQPIDAGADKQVSAKLLRQAIQFEDVAFAVADMNALAYLADALTSIVNGYPNSEIDQLRLWAYCRHNLKAVA
ncbi:hypothetical protein CO683_38370 [Bradyrhizobium ottawaense]|uniref:hypothetical protein n=1 Tax=Bradyrhizobium TaxID=374 RepID=UPI000BE8612D|nr:MULTISPECIES: hypothetical protein [Bradyrhizobium]MDA9391362.1 hypothetical protein [Bradyrhizobium sp. CCBAU 45394]MDA9535810.1 hypothetical protein [Bradyrhizobium sp. CCBAU 21362]PDT64424.1 hypothetical protein CO683_38370 [Bradyrhizobium ottawaense]